MSLIATPTAQQRRKVLNIRPAIGGLKMDQDSITVDPHYCVDSSNWSFYNGEVVKRPGLSRINAAVLGGASTYILGSYRFRLDDGTVRQVAVTPTRIYQIHGDGSQTDLTNSVFTGTTSEIFTFCVANDEMIATNGVDAIRRWDGVAPTVSSISGSGAPSAAKYVDSFVDRIVAAHTIEGGVTYPRRVRWSNNASNTAWNGTSSGFADLLDTQGWITGIKKLRDRIVVYKEDSLVVGVPTGIASAPINFNQRVSFNGTVSGWTVADIGDAHIFLGRDNVYMFDLNGAVPIGDSIREELFSTSDFGRLQCAHAHIKDDRREYWLWVTAVGDTVPKRAWCYNYLTRTWSKHTFPLGIVSSAQYALDDNMTIDSLTGTIDEQNWRLDDRSTIAYAPYVAVGGTVGFLYYLNTSVASDDGTSIDAYMDTPDIDFGRPGYLNTITQVAVKVRNVGATNMTIGYSKDGAATLIQQTASFTPGLARWSFPRVHMISTGEQHRIRVRNSQAAASSFTEIQIDYVERGRVF